MRKSIFYIQFLQYSVLQFTL